MKYYSKEIMRLIKDISEEIESGVTYGLIHEMDSMDDNEAKVLLLKLNISRKQLILYN